jgi:hypothetical protein
MSQDIGARHGEKAIAQRGRPFLAGKFVSIHPAPPRDPEAENPEGFCAPAYFFLFLKFIHRVVPTINISTAPIEIRAEPE